MNILILIKNHPMPCRSCVLSAPGEPDNATSQVGLKGSFSFTRFTRPRAAVQSVPDGRAGR